MRINTDGKCIVLIALFFFFTGSVRSDDTIKTVSTEIIYTRDDTIIKFRPFYFKLPSETQQTHLMAGKSLNSLEIYGYWKSEDTGKAMSVLCPEESFRKFAVQKRKIR